MHRILVCATRALVLAAVAAGILAAPAAADVYVTQAFTGATAPGWSFLGNAKLTAASGGTDTPGNGWLQLTTAGNSQTGSAINDTAFPSDEGVVAQFDAVAYGGTGADGISFFLLDGSVASPTIGATGQGLGYTNDCTVNGVSKGYVAVGMDEYGNFSEGTSFCKDGPGRTPNSFAIRGPGDGKNANNTGTQYRYLAGTTPPSGTIAGTSRSDVRRYSLYISPSHKVSLSWRPTVGGAWQPLLTDVVIPGTVPATFKLGFSASTGGSTNVHEIRNLVVGSPVNLGIATTGAATYATRGSTVSYTVTATNAGPNPATGASVTDTVPAALQDVTWTCTPGPGASCGPFTSGSGSIDTLADLPVGAHVTYAITGTVDAAASGTFANAASITPPDTAIDTDATDNAQSTPTTINDAPVVGTTAATLHYTENDAATVVDPGVTAGDPDANLSAGSVAITGGFASGEDVLSYAKPAGSPLNGAYNAATGVLTLTGSATPAQWQAALRAVAYRNTSENPSTASRTISFQLTDAPGLSASATRTVAIAATDDAPAVTAGGTLAYTENQAATAIAPAIAVTDVDDGETSATVTLASNFRAGEDVLAYTAPAGNPISGSFNAATGVLTLTGGSTAAQYQEALRAVTYRNTSDAPSTSDRGVAFSVNGASGVSGSALRTVTVTAVADPPTITTTASPLEYTEDDGATPGDPGVAPADPDGTLASASVLIATGYAAGEDRLAFTPIAGNPITGSFDAVTGSLTLSGTATPAQYAAALRAVTYENTSEDPGTQARTLTYGISDGTTVASASRTLHVTAVDDPALVALDPVPLAYTEDDPATSLDPAATVTDPDGGIDHIVVAITGNLHAAEDALAFTAPAGNPATASYDASTGRLVITGASTLAQWQAALRAVTYADHSQNPSEQDREVTVTIVNLGPDATAARTITVTRAPDAPTLTTSASSLAYTEGDGEVAADAGVDADDPDGALAGASVAITSGYAAGEDALALPPLAGNPVTASWDATAGVLTLSGSTDPADYRAALRAVTYADGSEDPSTAPRTLTFTVTDGGASASDTRTVDVNAVNDAPVVHASGSSLELTESGAPVPGDPAVTAADPEGDLASAAVAISANYDAGHDLLAYAAPAGNPVTGAWDAATGTLALSGPATVAQFQAALRAVTVRSTSIAADPTRVLRYSVTDGGGLSGHDERAASVAPRPPVADTAPALAGVLRTGGTVTGARGDWSGTEPIAYAYQWERCDGASCVPIAGATGLTHVVSADDAGHALRLQVVADNAAPGTVTAHSPRSAVVAPALAAPTIAGGPDVTTTSTDAAFALVAEPGAELQCSLDGGPWEPCGARHTRSDLPVGAHELRVRQTLDGLTSPEAGYRWTVARPAVAPAAVGKVPNSDGSVRADAGTVAAVCGTSGAAMRSCAVVATVTVVVDGTRRTIVVGRGRTGGGKAGAERPVRIRLTPAGRRLLSRTGHLDATFAFTAVDAKGGVRGVSRRARITARLSLTVRRYFPVNDPHLTASTKAFLRHLAKRYPYATHLRCEGHADGTATDAHGLWLGLHRARNACGFLAGHGLRASRRIVTYGTRRPFASDRTGAGRARNRVVVITLSS